MSRGAFFIKMILRTTSKLSLSVLVILLACHGTWAQSLKIRKLIVDNEMVLLARNTLPCPLVVTAKSDTFSVDTRILILPDSLEKKIAGFPKGNLTDSTDINKYVSFSAKLGDPNARHDKSFRYQLPFEKKKSYELIQGFKGKFSHSSTRSKYALDFKMPIGEPVTAARDGVVCWIDQKFNEGGNDRSLINKANRVVIYHDDGTLASYVHIRHEGALVEVGDVVERGDLVALSGNVGFSTTPHLHFVVRSGEVAVKIKFKETGKLKSGRYYQRED